MVKLNLTGVALALSLLASAPLHAEDRLAGPYLAARQAGSQSDFRIAVAYYAEALRADPLNPTLIEGAILMRMAMGEVAEAVPIALTADSAEAVIQAANLLILADLAQRGDFAGALAELDGGRSVGPLIGGLFRAWALFGEGRMGDAVKAFEEFSKLGGMSGIGLYHKALALAAVGDFEGADAIFSGAEGGPLQMTRRGILAHVQVLSQLDRNPDAVVLLDGAFGTDLDRELEELRAELQAGKPMPFTMVTGANDGLAEVFYTVAGALSTDNSDVYTLSYVRIAEFLRPDHVDAILLSASILESLRQYDLATAAYDRIPRDDPAFLSAELGRAAALVEADRVDAAIEAMQQLAKSNPEATVVWITLGDTLRRVERYREAIPAYDAAIALFNADKTGLWPLYFARGIAHEREKRWPEAEADFRKALALSPAQASVLNYLGYSYLEMNTNLDEALAMIQRAVALEPEDGYITDSLGWAQFRLERYPEAVVNMERAVELMPVDSIVNDHLGDVYWAVGRRLEAEFQWRRALSFEPETEAEAARIRRKLEVGLDVVLKEEGAKPLAISANGSN